MKNTPSITSLATLPNQPQRRQIQVDGQTVATLSLQTISQLQLRPGTPWTPTLAQQIQEKQQWETLLAQAARRLNKRPLSTQKMRSLMASKQIPEPLLSSLIDRLTQLGLLDDASLGRQWIDKLLREKNAGPALIETKLLQLQLPPSLVNHLLSQLPSSSTPTSDNLLPLAQKKLQSMRHLPPATQARRLAGFLARRGHDQAVVSHILQQLNLLFPDETDSESGFNADAAINHPHDD